MRLTFFATIFRVESGTHLYSRLEFGNASRGPNLVVILMHKLTPFSPVKTREVESQWGQSYTMENPFLLFTRSFRLGPKGGGAAPLGFFVLVEPSPVREVINSAFCSGPLFFFWYIHTTFRRCGHRCPFRRERGHGDAVHFETCVRACACERKLGACKYGEFPSLISQKF